MKISSQSLEQTQYILSTLYIFLLCSHAKTRFINILLQLFIKIIFIQLLSNDSTKLHLTPTGIIKQFM